VTARRDISVGTTIRFFLLLALIAVSSLNWLRSITVRDRIPAIGKDVGCRSATGNVPAWGDPAAHAMYVRCMEGHEAALYPVWQQTLLALLALAAVALIIYVLLPTWKRRRRRLTPLDVPLDRDLDGDTADPLLAELAELRGRAGVPAYRVRFMLDPYDRSCSAVAFGRFGRNTISLNAGLVSRHAASLAKERTTDPAKEPNADLEAFRGVVLHELNHVANRDVGLTYATIAAWRSFLLVALAPAVALTIAPAFGSAYAGFATVLSGVKFLTGVAGLVAAVYLARADILRVREYHADVLPPKWRADVRGLLATGDDKRRPWHVHPRDAVRRLWHVHPSDAARRRALADPAQLFRTNLVPIGLAGVVAALIANQSIGLAQLRIATPTLWLTAVLALTVVAAPIWRAATYAADHGTPYPRGWREGTALGAGLVAGYVIAFPDASGPWLPRSPWLLVIVFAGAVVASVWMAQLASLSARRLPTRLRTPGFWAGQLTTVLAFGAPLVSFFYWGTQEVSGGHSLGLMFSGVISQDRWLPLPRLAALLLDGAAWWSGDAAAVAGAALAWLMPTVILIGSLLRPRAPLRPGMRRVFLPGFGGAVGALVVVTVINGLWHDDLLRPGAGDVDRWLYLAWLVAGLVATSTVVAAIATAVLPGPTVPYAVTAGGTALLLGTLGTAALWLADGCLGPFNVWFGVCTGRAVVFRTAGVATFDYLSQTLVIGLLSTIVAAVAASAVRDLGRHLLRRRTRPRTPAVRTSTPSPRAAIPLAVVAVALIAWTLPKVVMDAGAAGGAADGPQMPDVIAARTKAWWLYAGGRDLVQGLRKERAYIIGRALYAANLPRLTDDTTAGETVAIYRAIAQVTNDGVAACRRLSRVAAHAERFIPIPDRAAQSAWATLYTAARSDGDRCAHDLATNQMTIFEAAESLPPSRLDDRLFARLAQVGAL
jgi:hypothetical protein